jgi:hypothetical protein
MPKKKPHTPKGGSGKRSANELMHYLAEEMEHHKTAEALNDNVLIPFMAALEKVAEARGYVLNIYGEQSNLVFTSDEHAEQIYHLVESYLDDNAAPD